MEGKHRVVEHDRTTDILPKHYFLNIIFGSNALKVIINLKNHLLVESFHRDLFDNCVFTLWRQILKYFVFVYSIGTLPETFVLIFNIKCLTDF